MSEICFVYWLTSFIIWSQVKKTLCQKWMEPRTEYLEWLNACVGPLPYGLSWKQKGWDISEFWWMSNIFFVCMYIYMYIQYVHAHNWRQVQQQWYWDTVQTEVQYHRLIVHKGDVLWEETVFVSSMWRACNGMLHLHPSIQETFVFFSVFPSVCIQLVFVSRQLDCCSCSV